MGVQEKEENKNIYLDSQSYGDEDKKVNVNDLMTRMNETKKKERKNNIILSAAAVSAVTVFGIILTL